MGSDKKIAEQIKRELKEFKLKGEKKDVYEHHRRKDFEKRAGDKR